MKKVASNEPIPGEDLVSSCDLSPEARERRLTSLALDEAERRIKDGTASSQLLTHFLKLATRNYELEIEKLEQENELLKAKTENLHSQKRTEEFYKEVMDHMRMYKGEIDDSELYGDDNYSDF